MGDLGKNSATLALKILAVVLMSFFINMSISLLCTAAFTDVIGYTAHGTKEGATQSEQLYTYLYSEGEDTKLKEYEEQGYTIRTVGKRTEMTNTGMVVYRTASLLICLMIVAAFVYSQLWKLGNKDAGLVKYGHKAQDKLTGLKIGALSQIPWLLLYIGMLVCALGLKPNFPTAIYKLANHHYFSIVDPIIGNNLNAADLSAVKFILLFLPLCIIPLISFVSYIIGYKGIIISELLVYKKDKGEKKG